MRLAFALVCFASFGGCIPLAVLSDAETGTSTTGRDASPCRPGSDPGCVLATPGCDPGDIRLGTEGETCSTCTREEGAATLCGRPAIGLCFEQESSSGGACERCVTETGDVLYDDCHATQPDDNVTCEQVQRTIDDLPEGLRIPCTADADCVSDGVCFLRPGQSSGICIREDETERCEVCRDAAGIVVRETCRPEADECRTVFDGEGRACTECTQAGRLAFRACEEPDLQPERCEAYGDDVGRCVDCFAEDGTMLSHQCTIVGGPPPRAEAGAPDEGVEGAFDEGAVASAADEAGGYCDVYALPGGLSCTACYDDAGGLLSEVCTPAASSLRCEVLRYSEQTCVVCVDAAGVATYTDCVVTGCSGDGCPPARPCEVRTQASGNYCRVCPVGEVGATEQRCLSEGLLTCRFEDRYVDTEGAPGRDDGPAAPADEACLVCSRSDETVGTERLRRCGQDADTPPVCLSYPIAEGSCEVCFDPVARTELYSTCPWSLAPFGTQAGAAVGCSAPAPSTLAGEGGAPLWLPADAPGEDPPVVLDCATCQASPGTGTEASGGEDWVACRVRPTSCHAEIAGTPPAPVLCTERTRSFRYEATQCGDPWGNDDGARGLTSLIAWLLEAHGIIAWNGATQARDEDAACAACGCLRGTVFQVEVAADEASRMVELGFSPTTALP